MNREQMIEKATRAVVAAYGEDPDSDCPCEQDDRVAKAVVDEILPQVTTIEELEALPLGAKILDSNGEVWWHRRLGRIEGSGGGYSSSHELYPVIYERFLSDCGPLTVIWSPS